METVSGKENRRSDTGPGSALAAQAPEPRWLTVETAAYIAIALAALLVRLAALGRWPLLNEELQTALAAWRGVQGDAWRPAFYVPLLYDVQLLLFGLTRAGDGAARLLPALAGTGLVILPWAARDLLGRRGALCAALLLALAPTWVFLSRTADGAILAAACGAVLLLAGWRHAHDRRPWQLTAGAVALATGLTAGPQFYTYLLVAVGCAVYLWQRARTGTDENRSEDDALPVGWSLWRAPALQAVGLFVFLATGYLTNVGGIGASVGLLGRWLANLAPGYSGLSWLAYPRMLWGYEFLTLALAAVGLGVGLYQRERIDAALGIWVALALVLGTVLGHRQPGWALDALLPLVLLAARGLEQLWGLLMPDATRTDLVALVAATPFLVFAFLQVASYTHTGEEPYLQYALITVGILALGWCAYWIWGDGVAALRVGAGLVLLVMLVFSTRVTTAVAYQTARDPREGLVYKPTSVQVRDLLDLVAQTSSRQSGDPRMIDLRYDPSLEPWLAWYLRDYPKASVASIDFGAAPREALITPLLSDQDWPAGYAGQRFRLIEEFPAQPLTRRERLLWRVYREPVGAIKPTEVVFWLQLAAQ